MLTATAGVAVAALALTACGSGNSNSGKSSSSGAPLTIGTTDKITTIDPAGPYDRRLPPEGRQRPDVRRRAVQPGRPDRRRAGLRRRQADARRRHRVRQGLRRPVLDLALRPEQPGLLRGEPELQGRPAGRED